MTSTQGIKLDPATRERLKELGKLKQRTPHGLMRAAIEQFLEKEERFEREKQEDLQRWQRYQLSGEAVSQENVAGWLSDLAEGKSTPCPQ
jgi:predicted transcriptional regulator